MCISNSNYFAKSFFIPVAAPYLIILAMFYHESIRDFRRKGPVEFLRDRRVFFLCFTDQLFFIVNDVVPDYVHVGAIRPEGIAASMLSDPIPHLVLIPDSAISSHIWFSASQLSTSVIFDYLLANR